MFLIIRLIVIVTISSLYSTSTCMAAAFISASLIRRPTKIRTSLPLSPGKASIRRKQQQQHYSPSLSTYESLPVKASSPLLLILSRSNTNNVASNDADDEKAERTPASSSGLILGTFNLIKSCVGAGVLSLPYGLSCMSDRTSIKTTLLPGCLLVIFLGFFSGYTFHLLGRICRDCYYDNNNSDSNGICRDCSSYKSMGDVWEYVFGRENSKSWVVSGGCFFVCMGVALCYSILLGDAFSSLVQSAGIREGIFATRQMSIIAVTLSILLPLMSLPSLSSLGPVSLVGVLSVVASIIFMTIRSPIVGSGPYSLPNGKFISTLSKEFIPSFNTRPIKNLLGAMKSSLILSSMLAISYVTHFSAPNFFNSFNEEVNAENDDQNSNEQQNKKKTGVDQNIELIHDKFTKLTTYGFAGTCIINILIMVLGYMTFGGNCSSIILNNYSVNDVGASICRILFCISIIGSYPLLIEPMKNSLLTIFFDNNNNSNKGSDRLALKIKRSLLAIITAISLVVKDAGFVISLNGAIMGSAVIYIYPAILYLKHTSKSKSTANIATRTSRVERYFVKFMLMFGILASIVGGIVTVLNTYFPDYLF